MGIGAYRWLRRAAIFSLLLTACWAAGSKVQAAAGEETNVVPAAERLVTEALQAEVTGDSARRRVLLSVAIDAAPDYLPARWHSGQVLADGEWMPIDKAQQAAAADPKRAEYEQLRASGGDTLDGQLALARWCRKHGLEEEARFHWKSALGLEAGNEEAQRALGVRWYNGELMAYAEIDKAKERVRTARRASKRFVPQVGNWQRQLAAGDVKSRDAALAEIRALRSTDAIPVLEDITLEQKLATNSQFELAMQVGLAWVDALDQMPADAATQSLLRHARLARVSDVRKAACSALKRRSPHGYVPQLLALLTTSIESTFRVVSEDDGSVHYWHSLYREGRDANWSIEGRSSLIQNDFDGSTLFIGDDGRTVLGVGKESDAAIAARMADVASRSRVRFANSAVSTEQRVARLNEEAAAANARVIPILQNVTDQKIGNDPKAWWDWWDSYNEYSSDGQSPLYERRYVESQLEYYRTPGYAPARHSCFAAGTMVWTKTGLRAIETLEIGDFVLTQNATTGELSYKNVMGRTVRPARPTLLVRCGSDSLQATLGHPMWVSGKGWTMAKELRPGDVLHGVEGPMLVESVESAETIDVYNLIVADAHNYFVGEAGVLVHDNSPRQPTTTMLPGLAVTVD